MDLKNHAGLKKIYDSLQEVFERLENCGCNYLVLRNYEEFDFSENQVCGDIDFLCYDREKFVKILGAKKRDRGLNSAHYEIIVRGKRIELDVREVGDGYYCKEWERNFLKERILFEGRFWVMDRENYYFSLLYHCLVHKGKISDSYRKKLSELSGKTKSESEDELREELSAFMLEKNYKITNSSDWELNVHLKQFKNVDGNLFSIKRRWTYKKKLCGFLFGKDCPSGISESSSKRITSLRFLLMLFVMIKHNALVKGLFMRSLPFSEPKAVTFIKEFFATGLGELAVPVFFVFSAYLLASSRTSYFTKIRKRFFSLFLPYTLWTLLYFAGWLLLKEADILTGFVNPCMDLKDWSFGDYVMRFVGYNGKLRFPFVGSFWFLRDLMILVLLSPVILFFLRRFPLISLLTVILSYFFNIRYPVVHADAVLYFMLGAFFALRKIDFFELSDKIRFRDSVLTFIVGFVIFFFEKEYRVGNNFKESPAFFLFVISGIVSLLKLSKIICGKNNLFSWAKKLAPLTFFVYAVHAPILAECIKKITLESGMPSFAQFVTACVLDIGLSLIFALILRKLFPAFFYLLTGGKRSK